MFLDGFNFKSQLGKDIVSFVESVVYSSEKHILLIPHVMWLGQDDRIVCRMLYDKYKHTGRVHLLDSASLNYCQIRYVISKCFIFIGAGHMPLYPLIPLVYHLWLWGIVLSRKV